MYQLHPANRRGRTYTGWLDSYHTFSFGSYHDPRYMNFGSLRVINDDIVAPGTGFDMHPHDNMEIVSIVLRGKLQHRDNLGNGDVLKPGDVQKNDRRLRYHTQRIQSIRQGTGPFSANMDSPQYARPSSVL